MSTERRKRPLAVRFWEKVDRRGPDECWPWTAHRHRTGYGRFGIKGRIEFAHRVALSLDGTTVRTTDCVLHSCDNPPCCNPAHLRVGTVADNSADMMARGRGHVLRHPVGEDHPRSKFTDDQVREMRRRHASGESLAAIGRAFHTTYVNVRFIVQRRTWRHVA